MDPDHYQIEAIVAISGHQYFLKWFNYPDSENTWEAAKRVEKTAPDLVAAYERGDSAPTQQAAARAARVANRAAFQAPVESADGIAAMGAEARGAAQKAIEGRVRKYSATMAATMLKTFDERLPMPEVLIHLREVYDFRRMPWHNDTALEAWSDDSMAWLVAHQFPKLDVETLQSQALKVRMWLRENLDTFYQDVQVYNSDGDAIKKQFKKQLALCGEGSIFEALFTRSDALFPSGIQDYLHVADYNISYITTQCATERIGRNMTLTKPPERSSLGDQNFKMLVWISYNCPPIHQVDFSKYVDVWVKEKHQLAMFQSGGEQRVLERKARERKHTVLCDKLVD
jgi:hypothetical protein